ncbi:MAG: hypothetical protein IKS67_01900, partial [Victivallales bacterium]|nr:hypothetical protein [Victivallales bacterium]
MYNLVMNMLAFLLKNRLDFGRVPLLRDRGIADAACQEIVYYVNDCLRVAQTVALECDPPLPCRSNQLEDFFFSGEQR